MEIWIRDDDYHQGMAGKDLAVPENLIQYCNKYIIKKTI